MDASNWLDTQDQAKVTKVIDQLREKNWVVGSTDYTYYAGDQRYLLWLYLTDRRWRKVVGLSIFDLSDATHVDFYQNGAIYSAMFGG
jgi:hypothetical protein